MKKNILALILLFLALVLNAQYNAPVLTPLIDGVGNFAGLKKIHKNCATCPGDFYVAPGNTMSPVFTTWFKNANATLLNTTTSDGLANTKLLLKWNGAYNTDIDVTGMPNINLPPYSDILTPIGAVEYCFRKNYDTNGVLFPGINPQNMWYLPALDELILMHRYRNTLNLNLMSSSSSTERSNNQMYTVFFEEQPGWSIGPIRFEQKTSCTMRCVRRDGLSGLFTSAATNIKTTSAIIGGQVYSDGGLSITQRGICYSTTTNPPTISDSKVQNAGALGAFSSALIGLTSGATYYARSYATTSAGTGYGPVVSFQTVPPLGGDFQGGKLAYILQSTDPGYIAGEVHGLIVAPTDIATTKVWNQSVLNGLIIGTGTAVGTGATNTAAIVAAFPTTDNAAKNCSDLVVTSYKDWFLPSKDELLKIMVANPSSSTSGIALYMYNSTYWSSSENNNGGTVNASYCAWGIMRDGTTEIYHAKYETLRVRCIRRF